MHKKTVKRIFINDSMPDAHLVILRRWDILPKLTLLVADGFDATN